MYDCNDDVRELDLSGIFPSPAIGRPLGLTEVFDVAIDEFLSNASRVFDPSANGWRALFTRLWRHGAS